MSPIAEAERHDPPGLGYELVPGMAAVIDEVVVAAEDAIGDPVLSEELPNVLLGVELGAFRRQRNDADVGGHRELRGGVPPRLTARLHSWSDNHRGLSTPLASLDRGSRDC